LTQTYISAIQIEVSVRASVAVPSDDVRLAAAVSGEPVADRQKRFVVKVRTHRVALTGLATWRVSRFPKGKGVAEKARFAAFAVEAVLLLPNIIRF
jgi:hypothetical protein